MTACDDFPQSSSFSFVLHAQDILVEATKSEIAAALEISVNNASFFLERVDHLERSCAISRNVNQILCQQCEAM